MAKKTVASFQSNTNKKMTKVIRMTKSPKTGAYIFVEKVLNSDEVNAYLKK